MGKPTKPLQSRHQIDLSSEEFRGLTREFRISKESIDVEARTVEVSFASEEPVERWYGREILTISREAADLSRLNNGGSLLVDHEWRDQVGVIVRAWVDLATQKTRAIVRFSRSVRGEEIFQDVIDGIRTLISVGYIVRKMVLESVEGDMETHRVTDWMPFEISFVAVPADATVGVGRSAPKPKELTAPNIIIPPTMTDEEKREQEAKAKQEAEIRADAAKANRERVAQVNQAAKDLAERHPEKRGELMALAAKCAETGDDINAFRQSVLADNLLGTSNVQPDTRTRQTDAGIIGMKPKEIRQYSIMRAVRRLMENQPLDGYERELSDEIAKRTERQPKGFFVPDDIIRNPSARTLLGGNAPDGGYTVATDLLTNEFLELLRNQTRVVELGARILSGLRGDISIPRQLTGATAAWASETGSLSASSATFGQIVGKPRRIGTSVPYSRQFLAQTSLDAEAFVREDSMKAIAVELDRVAINGSGGDQPLGILNMASGDLATAVTFGAAPTWPKYMDFFQQVAEENALLGTPAYLTTPASAVKAATTPKFSNTATPIWDNDNVGAFRARWSNQFPSGDKVIFADFSQVMFLEWAGIDVIVDPYTDALNGNIKVTIQRLIDMVIRRGKSISRSADSGAQ